MGFKKPGPKELFLATRPYSLLNSVAKAVVGGCVGLLRAGVNFVSITIFALTIIGVAAFQASENLLNDYYDVKRGADAPGSPSTTLRAHSVYTIGLTLGQVKSLGLFLLALGSGMVVAATILFARLLLPVFLGAGVALLAMYSGPVGLKYRGVGEVDIFFASLTMVVGSCYTVAGNIPAYSLLIGVPVGLLATSVALADDIRDYEWDRSHSVGTMSVRLGIRASKFLYVVLVVLAIVLPSIIAPPFGAITLLSLPLAIVLIASLYGKGPIGRGAAVKLRFYMTMTYSALIVIALLLQNLLP